MTKKTRAKSRTHHDVHHIIPRSRGGSDDASNLYYWRLWDPSTNSYNSDPRHERKHDAWHTLFHNLLPEEAKTLVEQWARKDGSLDLRYFQTRKNNPNKRFIAWRLLFNDMKISDVIAWINREFIRKEWLGR